MSVPRAVVFGISGPVLTADERAFLREADPLGLILFSRNCRTPDAVRRLTGDLRDAVGRGEAPILVDQEGGRVMRLRPPVWQDAPAASEIARLHAADPSAGAAAAETLGRMLGAELRDLGIDVNCAPVLDLSLPQTSDAIGDRAYSGDPAVVAGLGGAMARGLMREGCLPVIKHLPGHGRGSIDSHEATPRVPDSLETLRRSDFAAFRPLSALPLGMSAHVVYEAIDSELPGTVSSAVIEGAIRGDIGFDGFLFSDDIAMGALDGPPAARAAAALEAGCDAVLHGTGTLDEMAAIAAAAPELSPSSASRWARAGAARTAPEGAAADELALELAGLLRTRS